MVRLAWASLLLTGILSFAHPAAAARAGPLDLVDFEALRLAVVDLAETYPEQYTKGQKYLRRAEGYERRLPEILAGLRRGDPPALKQAAEILAFQREVLLANPLLDFDRLLLIKRVPNGDPRRAKGDGKGLGKYLGVPQQSSWQQDNMPDVDKWENEIAVMSDLRSPNPSCGPSSNRPARGWWATWNLHYDADRILFSMPNDEAELAGLGNRRRRQRLSPGDRPSRIRTSTTTTPAICPTARSCSSPRPRCKACRATRRSTRR